MRGERLWSRPARTQRRLQLPTQALRSIEDPRRLPAHEIGIDEIQVTRPHRRQPGPAAPVIEPRRAAVNNLFDRKVYDTAVLSAFTTVLYSAYPLPERTFTVSVSRQF